MASIKLTDGAVSDVPLVRAIICYKAIGEGGGELFLKEKHDALQKVIDNGTSWRVRFAAKTGDTILVDVLPIIIIIAFIVVLLALAIWLNSYARVGSQNPDATNVETEKRVALRFIR
jgi:hypothetical protein